MLECWQAVDRLRSGRPRRPVTGGTPLWKKLGVKATSRLGVFDAPPNIDEILGELPEGARVVDPDTYCDVTLWFVTDRATLERDVGGMLDFAGNGQRLWIAWPKKASGVVTDLSDAVVRQSGLAVGLVDYKVCAIDDVWSGLCFSVRRTSG